MAFKLNSWRRNKAMAIKVLQCVNKREIKSIYAILCRESY